MKRRIALAAKAILVFPNIIKAGLVFGGAYGEGVLFKGGRATQYYNSLSGSWGFQAGAQSYGGYAVFLMTDKAVDYLDKSDGWEIGVGPAVVIVDKGVAKNLSTTTLKDDAYAFIFDQQGLMAGVALEGTKISRIRRQRAGVPSERAPRDKFQRDSANRLRMRRGGRSCCLFADALHRGARSHSRHCRRRGRERSQRRTAKPVRRTIAYTIDGRHYTGDLYHPGSGSARTAAVFVPGVVRRGKDDPRLVAFANSFSRAGFLVLVPEIPNLRALVVSASESRIADAVRHVAVAGRLREERSVGILAFSYAAGPALIAALEPDAKHLVRFVYAIGPYYSVASVPS